MPHRSIPRRSKVQVNPPLILQDSPTGFMVTFPTEAHLQAVPQLIAHKPHIALTAVRGFIGPRLGFDYISYYNPHMRTTHFLLDHELSGKLLKFLSDSLKRHHRPTSSDIDQFLNTFWILVEYTMSLVYLGAEKPCWIHNLLPNVERLSGLMGYHPYHPYGNISREQLLASYYNYPNAACTQPYWILNPPGKESVMSNPPSPESRTADAVSAKPKHGGYSSDSHPEPKEVTVRLNNPTAKAYRLPKPDELSEEKNYAVPGWVLKALAYADPTLHGQWLVRDDEVIGGCTRWSTVGFVEHFSVIQPESTTVDHDPLSE